MALTEIYAAPPENEEMEGAEGQNNGNSLTVNTSVDNASLEKRHTEV